MNEWLKNKCQNFSHPLTNSNTCHPFFRQKGCIHYSLEQVHRIGSPPGFGVHSYLATITMTPPIIAPSTNCLPESGWGGLLQYPGLSDCSWHMVIRAGISIIFPAKMKGQGQGELPRAEEYFKTVPGTSHGCPRPMQALVKAISQIAVLFP